MILEGFIYLSVVQFSPVLAAAYPSIPLPWFVARETNSLFNFSQRF